MRHTILRSFFLLALLTAGLFQGASLHANDKVYARTVKSTVIVETPKALGAGTLIDAKERLIVTANHVVGDDKEVNVYFAAVDEENRPITALKHYVANQERLAVRGTVVAQVERCDLALIQLTRLPEGVVAAPLAARSAQPGQEVHILGHSSILRGAVFNYSGNGKIRNVVDLKLDITILNAEGRPKRTFEGRIVETTILSREGDSGGPVVNNAGELVAVVSGSVGGPVNKDKDANEVQVNMDIDVSEVKAMLKDAGFNVPANTPVAKAKPKQDTTAKEPAAKQLKSRSLVGVWTRAATDAKGNSFTLKYQFGADSNVRILKVDAEGDSREAFRGQYELTNDKLTFKSDGKVRLQLLIEFVDANRVTVHREGGESLTWKRSS
jgi:S1-C subfamily serine protease